MAERSDRSDKKVLVYMTEAEKEILQAAAQSERRSLSSYMVHWGMVRAKHPDKSDQTGQNQDSC